MNNYIPSVNESINAKNTAVTELCNTFINNEYYNQLASTSHTIMKGPRGSGKTTLMRMLEVRSLEFWDKDQAVKFREIISFSGVFIPTDRVWKAQYESTSKRITSDSDLTILRSQFVYHVIQQLAQSVSFRTCRVTEKKNNFRHVNITKSDESELVSALSELWVVKPRINSFKSLIASIALKKSEVSRYLNKAVIRSIIDDLPEVIELKIDEVLDSSISIINTYLGEDGGKWAFLFDELELAPDEIVQPLIDSMRGGHQDVILKLALSPYHKGVDLTNSPESSMKNQDLSFIDLTELSEQEGTKFAKELCSNLFQKKAIFEPVEQCFESPSEIDIDKVFDSLSEKDTSFSDYLSRKGTLGASYSESNDKQSQMRKVKFVAYLRDHITKGGGKLHSRRRAADFYAGFDNICKATEYNPRMLIGIMNQFIPTIKAKGFVSISEQISGLNNYFESFRSLLSTIAVDYSDPRVNNIYDLVDIISSYFKDDIYNAKFTPEPKGILIVDHETPPDLRDAIGFALNAGAMISVKGSTSVSGEFCNESKMTCRLSYLFSHHYGLLLTKQKSISLEKIMFEKKIRTSNLLLVDAYKTNENSQLRMDF